VVYCIGVSWMKIGALIVLGSLPYLDKIGEWVVGWTKGDTTLQIIFVMFVCLPFSESGSWLTGDITFGVEHFAVLDCG
jgi:hypothetical protein